MAVVDENVTTVGAVVSRVIVVDAVAAVAGPVLAATSLAPFAANAGVMVPAEHVVIVTVRVEPESVPGANTQPVAVPAFEKSPAATPVTASENVSVNVKLVAVVGVELAEVNDETVGAVVSTTIA